VDPIGGETGFHRSFLISEGALIIEIDALLAGEIKLFFRFWSFFDEDITIVHLPSEDEV
jgi:hypothetical protein